MINATARRDAVKANEARWKAHRAAKLTNTACETLQSLTAHHADQALSTIDPDSWPGRDRIQIGYDGSSYGGSNTPDWRVIDGVAGTQTLKHLSHMSAVARKGDPMRLYLTIAEAADVLEVGYDSVHNAVKAGSLQGYRASSAYSEWRIRVDVLRAYAHDVLGYVGQHMDELQARIAAILAKKANVANLAKETNFAEITNITE